MSERILDVSNWRVSTWTPGVIVITASPPGVLVASDEVAAIPDDTAVGHGRAEFIVRACRSHADLLAACEAFEGYDPYAWDGVYKWFDLVRQIRDTLARVRGQTPRPGA